MQADFANRGNDIPEMVFQGARQLDVDETLTDEFRSKLTAWRDRDDPTDPGLKAFSEDGVLAFAISYEGESQGYWPDEDSNAVPETLVRTFLFNNGICNVDTDDVRLYRAGYKVEALEDDEYLLVCPYPTASGNIAGVAVVCVNMRVKKDA